MSNEYIWALCFGFIIALQLKNRQLLYRILRAMPDGGVPQRYVIQLTDSNDREFARQSQGAIVQKTKLPSGIITPDEPMTIMGTALVGRDRR